MASLTMKDHSASEDADFNPSDLDSEITDGQLDELSDLGDDDLSADLFDSDVLNEGDGKGNGVEGNADSQFKTKGSGTQDMDTGENATANSTDFRGTLLSRNLFDNLRNSELTAQMGKRDADETSVGSKKRNLEETFNRLQKNAMSRRNPIRRHSIHNMDVGTHRTFTDLVDTFDDDGEFRGGKRKKDKPVRANSVGALDHSILTGIDFNNLDSDSSDSEDEESSDGSDHNDFFFKNIIPRYQKSSSLPTPKQLASGNFSAMASNMSNMGQSHISPVTPFPGQSHATPQHQPLHSVPPMSNSSPAPPMSDSSAAMGNNSFNNSANNFLGSQMSTPFDTTYNAAVGESPITNMQPYFSEPSSTMPMQSQMATEPTNGFQSKFANASATPVTQQPQQRPNFDPQNLQGLPINPSPFAHAGPETNPNSHINHMPPQEKNPMEIDQAAMMVKLSALMDRSMETQKSLQEFDKANGLPRSHSQTMVKSNRSRRQLQEGVILKKWDGSPLLNFDKDGKVKDDGKKKRQTKKTAKKSSATKKRDPSPSSSKDKTTKKDLTDDSLEPLAP